jgi:hypothetical protein
VTNVTQRYFALTRHNLPITDGCWSGKAMLLLEPTQFLLPVPELERPLLVQGLVLLASVLALPLLALPAF